MISEQYACSHSCVTRAVCAEAPSCWKVNSAGINCLQSTISLISILFTGTHELLLLLHPCSRSDCIRLLSAGDTFPILTVLTKCWLKTGMLILVLVLKDSLRTYFKSLS